MKIKLAVGVSNKEFYMNLVECKSQEAVRKEESSFIVLYELSGM